MAKNKPVEIWDAEFEHWHVLGPILWGAVAYIGAGVLHELDVPSWYVPAVGAGVCLLAPFVAIYKRFSFLLMAATTALLTWTTITTPWSRGPALVAAAGGVLFGMVYRALRTRESRQPDPDEVAAKAAEKGRYIELLETIGIKGMKEARRIPFAAGKTIVLLLPVNGAVTLARLKDSTEALEIAAARAGLDARFEWERGATAAEVRLHVFERDVLAEMLPLPFDRRPKSIHDPIQLGEYPTGEVCVVTFREVAALMVGIKGRGKSALINTHLQHITGCTDAVVWMLDGKGGETVRPWLQPFLDLVTAKPVINWAAVDEPEFDAILLAANAARKYRTGQARKTEPSPSSPAIIVIVEEASVITGVGRYGAANRVQLAQDGVTLGRSSCIDWLLATQRATLDMLGSGSMKSNLDIRYGLGVTEAQDARMIFPDGQMAQSLFRLGDDPAYRGTFLMHAPGQARVMPAKGYWMDPRVIPGIAETNAAWTAELDRGTADYVHETLVKAGVPGGYYGRWERLCATLGCTVPSQVAVSPSHRPVSPSHPPETGRATQAMQDAIAASRAKRDDDTFQALMDANFETVELEEDGTHLRDISPLPGNVPPILRLILAVFRARGGVSFLPTKLLCDELPGELTPHKLGRLMALCSVSPVEGVIWEGRRTRGYERDGIETSVKRGTWTAGAFDWQP